jgi:hypothetical protein
MDISHIPFIPQSYLAAQDKLNIKFGKLSMEDFNLYVARFPDTILTLVKATRTNRIQKKK